MLNYWECECSKLSGSCHKLISTLFTSENLVSVDFEIYPKLGSYCLQTHRRGTHGKFFQWSHLILESYWNTLCRGRDEGKGQNQTWHLTLLATGSYASPTSGEAYRDRRLTTNFELWVEIFCVPTCFHVRIPKPCLSVCPSVCPSICPSVRTPRKETTIASSISVLHK